MMNENWLEIVDSYKSSPFQNLSQADAISKALDWFRMLGWKKSNGTMSVASCGEDNDIMPIILSKTSPDGDLLPVIAVVVSRQNVENYADLASKAMSAAGCSLCLIISKEIKVLCKTDTEEETLLGGSILFEPNDRNGATLSSLLLNNKFEPEKFISFCHELKDSENKLSQLKEEIYSIPLDQDLFRSFLKDALLPKGYKEEDIDSELSKIKFQISPVEDPMPLTPHQTSEKEEKPKGTHDNTKFSFDGVNFFNKRDFVLKLIQKYVQDHPTVTLDELELQFPSNIISKRRGVIRPVATIMEWVEANPGVRDRFCLKPEEIITLHDGMQIAVHNQWGKHFPKILSIAKKLYTVTSDKPYTFELQESDCVDDPSASLACDSGITISETSLKSFIHK